MFDLNVGQRASIVGKTGSGKSTLICHMIEARPTEECIVLDSKGEPLFQKLSDSRVINGLSLKPDKKSLVHIVRPLPGELSDPGIMDNFLEDVYRKSRNITIVIDEAYMLHSSAGKAGPGLVSLLTRGRSRGIGTWLGTQRPAWASRFCFTESEHFFVMHLSHPADRKMMSEYTGVIDLSNRMIEPHTCCHINGNKIDYFRVPRFQEDGNSDDLFDESEKKWAYV